MQPSILTERAFQRCYHCTMLLIYCIVCTILLLPVAPLPAHAKELDSITFVSPQWPPLISHNSHGASEGLYFELMEELFVNRMGIQLTHKILPWNRIQRSVMQGEADFFISDMSSGKHSSLYNSMAIFTTDLHVFTYKDHPLYEAINSITDVKDITLLQLTPVTYIGNSWHENSVDPTGATTSYVNDQQQAVSVLAKKRADIMIEIALPTTHMVTQLGVQDTIAKTEAHFGPLSMHILMGIRSPFMARMDEINTTYTAMVKDDTVRSITEKYFPSHTNKEADQLTFQP